MKTSFRSAFLALMLFCIALSVLETGCASHAPNLDPGGVYSHPTLAQVDEVILGAEKSYKLADAWYHTNHALLDAKFPSLAAEVARVEAAKPAAMAKAWAARDVYADALVAYEAGKQSSPTTAAVDAALAALTNLTSYLQAQGAPSK